MRRNWHRTSQQHHLRLLTEIPPTPPFWHPSCPWPAAPTNPPNRRQTIWEGRHQVLNRLTDNRFENTPLGQGFVIRGPANASDTCGSATAEQSPLRPCFVPSCSASETISIRLACAHPRGNKIPNPIPNRRRGCAIGNIELQYGCAIMPAPSTQILSRDKT